mgnify:FL=1
MALYVIQIIYSMNHVHAIFRIKCDQGGVINVMIVLCFREVVFAIPSDQYAACSTAAGDNSLASKEDNITLVLYDPDGKAVYRKSIQPTFGN